MSFSLNRTLIQRRIAFDNATIKGIDSHRTSSGNNSTACRLEVVVEQIGVVVAAITHLHIELPSCKSFFSRI